MVGRQFQRVEISYLTGEVSSGDNTRAKIALQHLDQDVRRGRVVPLGETPGLETAILGTLNSGGSDEKVRRWSLNVLALIGRKPTCLEPIKRALADFENEPQVVASAISCIFKLDTGNALAFLRGKTSLAPELVQLAALQSVSAKELDLRGVKINIDSAPADILKMSLVLVGIDKAPEHIFDPRYTNKQIVKALGAHHEPIVSQYSVWAAAENKNLRASDIGINLKNFDDYPPNVRSYAYRLYGSELEYSTLRHEMVLRGKDDTSDEARSGLARGIRDSFYDGLEPITLHWWGSEKNADVQKQIVDHFVRQSHRTESYAKLAIELYEDDRHRRERERMEAMAAGSPLYLRFRKYSSEQELGPLFREGNVTNTYNIGNFQSGVTSFGGNASNDGNVSIELNEDNRQQAIKLLKEAAEVVGQLPASEESEVAEAEIAKAIAAPTKDKITNVVEIINKIRDGISGIEGAVKSAEVIAKIGAGLTALL
jgi:hypothetical protein